MKFHHSFLTLLSAVFPALALAEDAPLLELTKGDRWEYDVTLEVPHEAALAQGDDVTIKKTIDGIQAQFKKTRVYLGKIKPEGVDQEIDAFRMERAGQVVELEFSDFQKNAIYARGSQDLTTKDSQLVFLKKPLLVYSSVNKPGDQWAVKSGENNDGPDFSRKFRVFGEEEVVVPAGTFKAVRIVIDGQSGAFEIKQTVWFTPGVGFVKEEKTYYSEKKRLFHQVMELRSKTNKPL